jgi:methionine aminopeptidase
LPLWEDDHLADKRIILKTAHDLESMRPACEVANTVLEEVSGFIQPGITTLEVDEFAAERMHFGQ